MCAIMVEAYSGLAWHAPAMFGCSTVCPNCKHQFQCCAPAPPPPPPPAPCCHTAARRSCYLSGGGLVTAMDSLNLSPSPSPSPPLVTSPPMAFILPAFNIVFNAQQQPMVQFQQQQQQQAFIIPSGHPAIRSEVELQQLADIDRALRQSGWYYGNITFPESDVILRNQKIGTFLVRASSDPRHIYTLGVMTDRGPKSVRLHYINGLFRLDAQKHEVDSMPTFRTIHQLLEYYIRRSKDSPYWWYEHHKTVCMNDDGKFIANLYVEKALPLENNPRSLKHLARLAVHGAIKHAAYSKKDETPNLHARLELPESLKDYLSDYPYSI